MARANETLSIRRCMPYGMVLPTEGEMADLRLSGHAKLWTATYWYGLSLPPIDDDLPDFDDDWCDVEDLEVTNG